MMIAHPLHSLSVRRLCDNCGKRKARLDGTVARLKTALNEVKETIERIALGDLEEKVRRLEKGYGLARGEELDVIQETDLDSVSKET